MIYFSYSVFVKLVKEDDEEIKSHFTWKELSCINRVNEKIAKVRVILLYSR